jgi:hypothetical protein
MSDIIAFPKNRIVRDNSQHVNENIEKMKERGAQTFADFIVEDMVEDMVTALSSYGVDITDEQFMKDFSVTIDLFKATIYRSAGVKHRLHDYLDKRVVFVESENEIEQKENNNE